jgi:hypothetical protein
MGIDSQIALRARAIPIARVWRKIRRVLTIITIIAAGITPVLAAGSWYFHRSVSAAVATERISDGRQRDMDLRGQIHELGSKFTSLAEEVHLMKGAQTQMQSDLHLMVEVLRRPR